MPRPAWPIEKVPSRWAQRFGTWPSLLTTAACRALNYAHHTFSLHARTTGFQKSVRSQSILKPTLHSRLQIIHFFLDPFLHVLLHATLIQLFEDLSSPGPQGMLCKACACTKLEDLRALLRSRSRCRFLPSDANASIFVEHHRVLV